MHLFRFAIAAALSLGLSSGASAAIIPATGFTEVTLADLGPGVTVATTGSASALGAGVFQFPVTGLEAVAGGTTLYHEGSGLLVNGALALENFFYTLPDDPAGFPIVLSGNVNGGEPPTPLFEIDDELSLALTPEAGGALGFPAGTVIGNVTGVEYAAVPEPSSLVLLGSAIALAARRMRRA
jgi:hypothetical protein